MALAAARDGQQVIDGREHGTQVPARLGTGSIPNATLQTSPSKSTQEGCGEIGKDYKRSPKKIILLTNSTLY